MGWGTALWDRVDRIDAYTNDSIEFAERLRLVVAQVAQVEVDYARALKKIVRAAPPTEAGTSFGAAYTGLLDAVDQVANQHEGISSALLADVAHPLKQLHTAKSQERRNFLAEVAKLNQDLNAQLANLDKAKKKYEKAEKDSEMALAAFDKAERSDNVTKAKVLAARTKWVEKSKFCEATEQQLVDVTDETNQCRLLYYTIHLPQVLDAMQAMSENRASGIVTCLSAGLQCYAVALPPIQQSMDAGQALCRAHDKVQDSDLFLRSNTSGAQVPGDLPVHEKKARAMPKSPRTQRAPQAEVQPGAASDDEDDVPPQPAAPAPAVSLPPVLYCRAVYAFAGSNEGELQVAENEILTILQNDGSGWVLVCNNQGVQGYVPESYIALVNSTDFVV